MFSRVIVNKKMDIEQLQARARRIHTLVAADVFPDGAVLRCTNCGKTIRAYTADCAHYLKRGWPECCGMTMNCERPPEKE